MSTPNFLQIKPNGINLPSNTSTIVANPGDLTYNSTSNKYAVFNTASDFLLTESGASSAITGLTNANLSGSAGITNANLASMANNTVKANKTGSTGTPSDVALGSLTEATSAVLTITGTNTTIGATTIQVTQSTTSTSGYLSSTDWNTFNNKQSAFSGLTTNGIIYATSATAVASTTAGSQYQSMIANASGAPSFQALNLAQSAAVTGALPIANGGTGQITASAAFNALSPITSTGDLIVGNGTNSATRVAIGSNGQVLTSNGTTASWSPPSGGGSKNYLAAGTTSNGTNTGNGNFELGNTTGWSLGTVGTLTNGIPTGSPTFGSGAAGTLSFTTINTNTLSGSFSGSLVSTGATTQGNMLASSAFFIDNEDQAKVLTFKQYFSVASGAANCNFSGTSSNSFGIAVYDVTNSTWLSSTANFGMTQVSGIGYVTGTCQTNSNTTQLRYVLYCVNATTGAVTLNVDDISVGPSTSVSYPASAQYIGDISWSTPAFAWTNTGVTSYTNFSAATGSPTSVVTGTGVSAPATAVPGIKLASMPPGDYYFVATGAIADFSTGAGQAFFRFSDGTNFSQGSGVLAGSAGSTPYATGSLVGHITETSYQSNVTIQLQTTSNVSGDQQVINASSHAFSIMVYYFPTSNQVAQLSSDTDTRVCAASYYVSSSATPGTGNPFNYDTKLFDTHGAVTTGSGWKFTAPISGIYQVTGTINTGGTLGNILLYKNGSSFVYLGSSSADTFPTPCTTIQLNAGDFIDVRSAVNATWNGGSAPYLSIININRLSGPSVIAATESVNASYGLTTGGVVSANAVIKYDTKVKDTHNAFSTSTGLYTMPVSGSYLLTLQGNAASASFDLYIKINGVSKNYLMGDTGAGRTFSGAIILPYNAGDTVGVYTDATNTFGGPSTNGYLNFFSICRVGN